MLRRLICALLIVLLLTTCLSGCGMDIGHGLLKEFVEIAELEAGILKELGDNKESIKQELHELVDILLEEIKDWRDSDAESAAAEESFLVEERGQEGDI